MKINTTIIKTVTLSALLLLIFGLCGCSKKDVIVNHANLSLDLGIGNTHFEDESDFPAPSANAYLDVNASKIVIRDAYENADIIETPFIYNNSSTAYPRMKLEVCSNKMFIIYCPDISVPSIQFASTDDGGQSWTQSTMSLKNEMDIIDNFVVTFWTPRDGALIAVDGTIETFIYITNDSGKTWEKQKEAPPEQDWHDLLEYGTFLSRDIGIISYDYHSKAANQPNVYLTTNGGGSWSPLYISVPDSVMDSYAKAGKPFYDGEKINIPINIYSNSKEITNTIYFVSYDLAQSWQFYVDDGGRAEQIRAQESAKWAAANRFPALLFAQYETVNITEYDSVEVDETTRVDIYSLDIKYIVGDRDWSKFKLTHQMSFDDQMNIYVKDTDGTPLIFFIYEGDVFNYTYEYLGYMGQKAYSKQSSQSVLEKMIKEKETKDEIEELFNQAISAYSWFTPYVTDGIYNAEDSTELDGYTYFKALLQKGVDEEGSPIFLESQAELTEYLTKIFTVTTANNILRTEGSNGEQIFTEVDGKLYRIGGFTSEYTNGNVQFSYQITLKSDKKATLTVTVEKDAEGSEVNAAYDCSLARTEDGWRFDTFELPIVYIKENPDETGGIRHSTITNLLDWSELEYEGDAAVYELIQAIIKGEYANIANILGKGTAVEYIYLGPVSNGAYKISKRTRNGTDTIVLEVDDQQNNKYYTKYIRYTDQGVTLTDS